jgi:hypothetical protein
MAKKESPTEEFSRMSRWELLWEIAKFIVPMIVWCIYSLAFTNQLSCDAPRPGPYKSAEDLRSNHEQQKFWQQFDKR